MVFKIGEKIRDYSIIKLLGEGSFGTIYLVSKENKMYVIKELSLKMYNSTSIITNEINILDKIYKKGCVDYLLCYKGSFFEQNFAYIITEEFENSTTLEDFIFNNQKLSRKILISIFKQLINAFAYLHKLNIVHNDIKLNNILINKEYKIQVIDFGISCIPKECTYSGTYQFMAPEVLYNFTKYR